MSTVRTFDEVIEAVEDANRSQSVNSVSSYHHAIVCMEYIIDRKIGEIGSSEVAVSTTATVDLMDNLLFMNDIISEKIEFDDVFSATSILMESIYLGMSPAFVERFREVSTLIKERRRLNTL